MSTNNSFPGKDTISAETAKLFLEAEAVYFSSDKPFIFTSGWASPVYIDCRKLISFPGIRRKVIDFAVSTIEEEIGIDNFESIAGGETAGIPFAAWIAGQLDLPMQYVRKKPRDFARKGQIEGNLPEGQRVLLVDDLATDGRSKVNFCTALRRADAIVDHVFVLFYYNIFNQSNQLLKELGVKLTSLATWVDILAAAIDNPKYDAAMLKEVEEFLNDPIAWSRAHGGVAEERMISQPYGGRPSRI